MLQEILLDRQETVVGRSRGDLQFDDDDALSPEHALVTCRDNTVRVRDLGSANGSWLFITQPHALSDGDVLLIGSQVIRFRHLPAREQPLPASSPDGVADRPARIVETYASGAEPASTGGDVALLEQLRPDGSVRDAHYLSRSQPMMIGRDHGDWVFPYDSTMSSRHAEIWANQADLTLFCVRDTGSRNGVGVLVRGERAVNAGDRLLVGRKMLRLEL